MEKSLLNINDTTLFLVGMTISLLVWMVVFMTIEKIHFFKNQASTAVIATFVSMLSGIGILLFLGSGVGPHNVPEKASGEGTNLDFILLLYAALGIAIVLIAFFRFGVTFLQKVQPKGSLGHAEDLTKSVFRPNPGKGDKPAIEKAGKSHGGSVMIQDNCPSLPPTNRLMGKRVHHSDARKETNSNRMKR